MKMYTRARPNIVALVRTGDQLAVRRDNGKLIDTELAYADADLSDQLRWTVVHDVPPASGSRLRIEHTLGSHTLKPGDHVMTREAIELDPWSYVTRVPDSLEVPEQRQPVAGG